MVQDYLHQQYNPPFKDYRLRLICGGAGNLGLRVFPSSNSTCWLLQQGSGRLDGVMMESTILLGVRVQGLGLY